MKPCHNLARTFSSVQAAQMSPKRKMQTSTAYTSSTFASQPPPPPRSPGVPDTPIAVGIPQVNETRPPKQDGQYEVAGTPIEQKPTVSLAQPAVQKSEPTITNRPKTRPKLRARKAAMSLTPNAVLQLRALLDQPNPKLIKVSVRNRGCSGLAYHLDFVDKPDTFDEAVEQDGVKVLIDSKALFSIIGSEMDWVEDKLSQKFVFKNPNISKYILSYGFDIH